MVVVNPILHKRFLAGCCFGLGNFVGVVNRNMINATSVNVKLLAKILHAHGRTLNMPTRKTARVPGTFPHHCSVFSRPLKLPQREVGWMAFAFHYLHPSTGL